MALIKCSECGKEISDKADVCMNCGNPIQKEIENQKKKNKKSYNELTKNEKKEVSKERFKNHPFDIVLIFLISFIILLTLFLPLYIYLPIVIVLLILEYIYVKSLEKKYYEEKMFFAKNKLVDTKKNKKSLFQTFLLIAFILCTIILIIEIFNNKNMIIRDVDIYKSDLTTDQYGFLIQKKLYLIDLIYLLIKTICLIFPCISFLYYYLCMNYNIKIKKIANVIVIIHIVIFVLFLIAMKNNDTNCIIHYAENCISLHKNIYFIAYNIITMLIELFTIKKLNKSIYEVATDF